MKQLAKSLLKNTPTFRLQIWVLESIVLNGKEAFAFKCLIWVLEEIVPNRKLSLPGAGFARRGSSYTSSFFLQVLHLGDQGGEMIRPHEVTWPVKHF